MQIRQEQAGGGRVEDVDVDEGMEGDTETILFLNNIQLYCTFTI